MNNLKERIKEHEGCRHTPYKDSLGFLTVGYGRNLDAVAFTDAEIDLMFENDFARAKQGAETFFVYQDLNDERRGVLIEMIFQMGVWAVQTRGRAMELANIFRSGRL
jgi:lysozyme